MKPVIETHDLCKSYNGRTVVDHLNLTVPQGCVYGFLGPNGAGKSTTMKMLLGLIHPTSGSVRLLGQPLTRESRLALLRQTGSLIENPAGYLHLTAQENLEIVADLKGVPHKDIGRVLDIVHLAQDRSRKVGQYSLGMKQRLGIAMALLGSPKLLILDEPTNHMDLAGKEALEKMLTSYEGTVLFVSHDRYFINQVATGILEFGESDVQFYGMNYAQYLEEIKRQTPGRETGNAGGVVRKPADVPTLDDVFDKKKYYNPGKILSRLKRQLEKYEEQLAESESRMSELQLEMMDPELSANYEQLMELQTKIDEENQAQESLLERMMETELELEEMETSESAFVRRQERY